MSHILNALRSHKPLVIGLVVAPLGLYSGIKIKEWQSARKAEEIRRQVVTTAEQTPQAADTSIEAIEQLLEKLGSARDALIRKEAALAQELEAIDIKLERLRREQEPNDKK
ncbi:hypothetical protein GGI20_001884 [Coemansia sp. BCRC 34301]|nr:hypothetical protein GGI20_001884 [Coemansia sp. BCRC 34301]